MKIFARGFSFIGLMVALIISSAILLGTFYTYSAATGAIKITKDIQHYQDILRSSAEIYSRALKQVSAVLDTPNTSTLVLTHDEAGSTACNNTIPDTGFTETYTLADKTILCQIDAKPPEVLMTGVDAIHYRINGNLVEITIKPENWNNKLMPDGFKLCISLTSRIFVDALR